jgi:hypothetical protein
VPVHGGPRTGPRWCFTGGRPERSPGARNVTVVEEKGEGTAVILTGGRRGRRRGGNGRASMGKKRWRRRSVRAVLGRGEKRRGEGRGAVEGGDGPPLYRSRGGGGG